MERKLKFKKCKACGDEFQVFRSMQKVCSGKCGIELDRQKKAKAADKEHRQAKKRLRDEDRSFQIKKTQALFNKYIRVRDRNRPCISCARHHSGQYHAGHYRTVGANPELRFNEDNCHKQCSACNNHLSGNIVNYRINLIHKISAEGVEELEGPHEPKKYTIEQLKELQKHYSELIKGMEI